MEAHQSSNTFEDNSADPVELNFVAQSPTELFRQSCPQHVVDLEPAVFSFSTSLPYNTTHSSNLSLQNVADEAVNNLVAQARSRRRAQAKQMRDKLRSRARRVIFDEWQHVVQFASAADGLHSIKMALIAQR